MSPGGKVLSATLPMKNFGTINSDHMDFAIANTSSETGMDKFMRITKLTYDGKSLLQGGAGAVIPDYVAPMHCDISVNIPGVAGSYSYLSDIFSGAISDNDVICVGPGNYTYAPVTMNLSGVTLVSTDGPDTTSLVGNGTNSVITISADNVTIKGFSITNPGSGYGILVKGHNGTQILDNNIHDIGTSLSPGSAQAVYLEGKTGVNGFTVKNNTITNVGNKSMLHTTGGSGSAKGIYVGDTTGAGTITGVNIENNDISEIYASSVAYISGGTGGAGSYGVLVNYGGSTTGLTITNNTISDLEGLWSHAIGLEGPTPSASVTLNDIHDLIDYKSPSDSIGVLVDGANPNASNITIHQNNFTPNLTWGVVNMNPSPLNAENNWWGDFDPSDQVGGNVDYLPYANGAFVGFINGVDTITNGFADLRDFQTQGITNVKPGLSNAHERKDLVMDVQLDATTPNQYQGKKVEMTMTVTMQQGPTQ